MGGGSGECAQRRAQREPGGDGAEVAYGHEPSIGCDDPERSGMPLSREATPSELGRPPDYSNRHPGSPSVENGQNG
ncbi:hypothetical protein GCM10027445_28350 [Amycolatopsis endophytica]